MLVGLYVQLDTNEHSGCLFNTWGFAVNLQNLKTQESLLCIYPSTEMNPQCNICKPERCQLTVVYWGRERNKCIMTDWVERNRAACLRVRVLGFSPVQEKMETEICMRCPIERRHFNLCSHLPPEMGQYWVWNWIIVQLQPIPCTVIHIRMAFGLDNALC